MRRWWFPPGATPTYPVPADASVGPPPPSSLTPAGATPPPADQIADPVTRSASCGRWQLQSKYGNRWPAGFSWWEYHCADEQVSSYGNNCTGGGACGANCGACYVETQDSTDYFYWDGSEPAFYGEAYSDSTDYQGGDSFLSIAWWDVPPAPTTATAQWYSLGPFPLIVSITGIGMGDVDSSPVGCSGGYGCQASFDAGRVVTLTATPNPGYV